MRPSLEAPRQFGSDWQSLVYAIGDIHGSLRQLRELIARCHDHAGREPANFIFLGDYIDRGPQSAGVIRYLIDMQSHRPGRVIALKGNHEAMALGVLAGTMTAEYWATQGSAATLASYGIAHVSELPPEHIGWLRSLRYYYDDGRRFFVHAGVDPSKPLDAQDEHDLIWIREPFLSDARDYGRLIVHGHTPVPTGAPELRSNRLDIDTGAVYGGQLTAVVFTATQTRPLAFLQVD
jgi:serine/threonine protein phosphatase 1